jgi:hypothetical protein
MIQTQKAGQWQVEEGPVLYVPAHCTGKQRMGRSTKGMGTLQGGPL